MISSNVQCFEFKGLDSTYSFTSDLATVLHIVGKEVHEHLPEGTNGRDRHNFLTAGFGKFRLSYLFLGVNDEVAARGKKFAAVKYVGWTPSRREVFDKIL